MRINFLDMYFLDMFMFVILKEAGPSVYIFKNEE